MGVKNDKQSTIKTMGAKQFFDKFGMLCVLILICAAISIANEKFLTFGNWQNLVRQISINGILALGMTFVILSGGIDLSIGPVVALSGVIAAKFMRDHEGVPIAVPILLAILVCAVQGMFYGFVISWSGLPPFVVTLSIMQIARGIALAYTDGQPIIIKNTFFRMIGQGEVFNIVPVPFILFLVIFLLSLFLLKQTRFGRYIYAIGGNADAARASGVNVRKYNTLVYMLNASFVGLAGLILAARTQSGQPAVGTGFECDAIAAVVIGGTSMSGGTGGVTGTIIGILIIGVINNGLNLLGVSSYYQTVAKGLMILTAVLLDVVTKKVKK